MCEREAGEVTALFRLFCQDVSVLCACEGDGVSVLTPLISDVLP